MVEFVCVKDMLTHGIQLVTKEENSYKRKVNNLFQALCVGIDKEKFDEAHLCSLGQPALVTLSN